MCIIFLHGYALMQVTNAVNSARVLFCISAPVTACYVANPNAGTMVELGGTKVSLPVLLEFVCNHMLHLECIYLFLWVCVRNADWNGGEFGQIR